MATTATKLLQNYVGGRWTAASGSETLDVTNPATGEVLAQVPLSAASDLDAAVQAARAALPEWRAVSAIARAQKLFQLREGLSERREDLARSVTTEMGKTIVDARAEVARMIEMVEAACALPTTMQGRILEDVSRNVDAETIRQPVGVCAAIVPFNFPAMVPFWFLPFAIGCGNTFVLKPSEQVPLTQQIAFEVIDGLDLPDGVVNLVNGSREIVEGILDHPGIDAVSFVGSAPVAKIVYERAAKAGKRVQALGGAKNHMVVMPDAVIEQTVNGIIGSAFGAAGQRCMAGSVVVTVGEAHDKLLPPLREATEALKIGDGLDDGVDVGPVISEGARERIREAIGKAGSDGADVVVDGREDPIPPAGLVRRPDDPRRREARHRRRRRGDLRPGALDHPRRDARRGDRARELEPVRQRHVDLHGVRRVRAALPARGPGGHDRRQHRRRRARRVLPVQRVEGLVPRRPARARPRRRRVLHAQEDRDVALVLVRPGVGRLLRRALKLSGEQLEAVFAPEAGMVCCSLRYRGEELLGQRAGLEEYAKTGKTMGIPLLHPWANRLGEWSYSALGRSVELEPLEGRLVRADSATGLPNHGTLPRAWTVVGEGAAELDGASEAFPFPHTMRLEASVADGALRIEATVEAHDGPVPVCFGFHPYFVLRRDWHVELPVTRRLVLSEQQIPTGETEPVEPIAGPLGERTFDDGYDELTGAPFALEGGGRRIEVAFESGFPVAQVYAPPDKDLICFEPMTARADALRSGGFPVATPGEAYRAAFSITVSDA